MPRQFEFSYTTIATGQQTTFTLQDASEDEALANIAISEDVARAIRAGLRRLNTIGNVTVLRVTDTRTVDRSVISADPGP